MAEAIVLREHGGPEKLALEPVEVAEPGPGMVRLRQTAVGVNFHDCYVRSGLYRTLKLPGIPGLEASGVIESVGAGVEGLKPGDRAAYFTASYGAYTSERLVRADLLARLPDAIDDRRAAAIMVKGLTAYVLVHRVHRIEPGHTVLVHAAAGGVGTLLCQWARHLGATVIGTVGSEAKAGIARGFGCEHTILYREEDFVARVREITGGRGADVVYDSVGHDTFEGSLDCLAKLGHLVNFGQSSGPIDSFAVARLSRGSYSLTRPMLFHYVEDPRALQEMSNALFEAIAEGVLTVPEPRALALKDAATAHRDLEARSTTGSLVLLP